MKGYNYIRKKVFNHSRSRSDGTVCLHVLIAEKALGRNLPVNAVVHHVDENIYNNYTKGLNIYNIWGATSKDVFCSGELGNFWVYDGDEWYQGGCTSLNGNKSVSFYPIKEY